MAEYPNIDQTILVSLLSYKRKQKFAPDEWEKRGLNPSDKHICDLMEGIINHAIDKLLILIKNEALSSKLNSLVKKEIRNTSKRILDSEEKSFLVDCFFEIGSILKIDLSFELNRWLYGPIPAFLFKIKNRK